MTELIALSEPVEFTTDPGQALIATRFQGLAEVSSELEWFANIAFVHITPSARSLKGASPRSWPYRCTWLYAACNKPRSGAFAGIVSLLAATKRHNTKVPTSAVDSTAKRNEICSRRAYALGLFARRLRTVLLYGD